ncbi:proton-conducting transporter transmembrane domain-containing protein [Lentiprolixibacter aurantiacus]|uniref:Probable inorganic carbon transporter subunit DabB n=1 Tax=Lentiprolixibacter aurantiacus TaxID=2993939 RepID=A0AAE3SM56_9FLAO|nr:proton-conducting transporter membrane subunit [Lentiprolixibacter aurantiacus]MCX2718095.1 proton-conducting transporter membrane subunit [Lentiprolixibacter aurantiacus]
MKDSLLTLLPVVAPAVLLVFSFLAIRKKVSSRLSALSETATWIGVLTAISSGFILYMNGTLQSALLGWQGLGFAIRIDSLSMIMFSMIAILGLVVMRYSINYMDGDPRKNIFMARMAITIAGVELLVLSGNLGQLFVFWVITSICLHYLLVFYRSRPQAIAAARKKFIMARIGDVTLFVATMILYAQFGTGDLDAIFIGIQQKAGLNAALVAAAVLLVITAVLKSAQFPTHGWLVKVVETPTPVSAMLHAGLLNAGPFLMVRMSFLMIASDAASLLLIGIAGFTALFASVVYLTQPSIKVALGYSSIAHMGFSLLICGFGVYSAALLHVVAHSFYKAHAFLSSGSVIDSVRAHKIKVPKRMGSAGHIGLGILASIGIYALFCYIWGVNPAEDFSLMATGAIIVMGLSQVISGTLDSRGTFKAVLQTAGLAFFVALSFFSFEHSARVLLGTQIPAFTNPGFAIKSAAALVLAIYSVVVVLQLFSSRLNKNWGYALGIHLRNGLYANVIFDRMIGSLKNEKFKWANLTVREENQEETKIPVEVIEDLKSEVVSKS